MMAAPIAVRTKKVVSVQQILEWAFGRECAQIRTDPHARLEGVTALGVDMIWIMMQRKELGGVRIDRSPGRSYPHDDAEIVAAVVENLPSNLGGIGMAIRVAELARAGITPDWMPEARPRIVPREVSENQYGRKAKTEVIDVIEYKSRRGKVRRDVIWCPVTVYPSPAKIASCRRAYLEWWAALAEIRVNIGCVPLRDHVLSDVMPPAAPWNRVVPTGLRSG